jgi:hypothetical protein
VGGSHFFISNRSDGLVENPYSSLVKNKVVFFQEVDCKKYFMFEVSHITYYVIKGQTNFFNQAIIGFFINIENNELEY